jgi:hypothetical protein
MKQLFEDADPIQRKQLLIDNADDVVEMSYHKSFDSDQLANRKEDLVNTSIKIAELEKQIADYRAEVNEELKPLRKTRDKLISDLKSKGEDVFEKCYKMVNTEEKVAEFYNAEGYCIMTRPATREELSPNIFRMSKAAAEDKEQQKEAL